MKLSMLRGGKIKKKRRKKNCGDKDILDWLGPLLKFSDKPTTFMPSRGDLPFAQITHGNVPYPGLPKHLQGIGQL